MKGALECLSDTPMHAFDIARVSGLQLQDVYHQLIKAEAAGLAVIDVRYEAGKRIVGWRLPQPVEPK